MNPRPKNIQVLQWDNLSKRGESEVSECLMGLSFFVKDNMLASGPY